MKIIRECAPPSSDTFDVLPILMFVKRYLGDAQVAIDPFARNKQWATYTNDLDPGTKAEYHMDVLDFLQLLVSKKVKADLVLFDPPFTREQCVRSYRGIGLPVTEKDTQRFGTWAKEKDLINQLLTLDGIVLSFGYNSTGLGKKRGFEIIEILLVNHGAGHYDTICIAEKRRQQRLF